MEYKIEIAVDIFLWITLLPKLLQLMQSSLIISFTYWIEANFQTAVQTPLLLQA